MGRQVYAHTTRQQPTLATSACAVFRRRASRSAMWRPARQRRRGRWERRLAPAPPSAAVLDPRRQTCAVPPWSLLGHAPLLLPPVSAALSHPRRLPHLLGAWSSSEAAHGAQGAVSLCGVDFRMVHAAAPLQAQGITRLVHGQSPLCTAASVLCFNAGQPVEAALYHFPITLRCVGSNSGESISQ